MDAGGVVELSAVVTIVGTTGSVKSVVLGRNPGFTAEHTRNRTSGASCRPPADDQRGSCWPPPAPDTPGWNARDSAPAQPAPP